MISKIFYIDIGDAVLCCYQLDNGILASNFTIFNTSEIVMYHENIQEKKYINPFISNIYDDIIRIVSTKNYANYALYFSPVIYRNSSDIFYMIIDPISTDDKSPRVPKDWKPIMKNSNSKYVDITPSSRKDPPTMSLVVPNIYLKINKNQSVDMDIYKNMYNLILYGNKSIFDKYIYYCMQNYNYSNMNQNFSIYFSGIQIPFIHAKIAPVIDFLSTRMSRILGFSQELIKMESKIYSFDTMSYLIKIHSIITGIIVIKTSNNPDYSQLLSAVVNYLDEFADSKIYKEPEYFKKYHNLILTKIFKSFGLLKIFKSFDMALSTQINDSVPVIVGGYNNIYLEKYNKYKKKLQKNDSYATNIKINENIDNMKDNLHNMNLDTINNNLYDINSKTNKNIDFINAKMIHNKNIDDGKNIYFDTMENNLYDAIHQITKNNLMTSIIAGLIEDGKINPIIMGEYGLNDIDIKKIYDIDTNTNYQQDNLFANNLLNMNISKDNICRIMDMTKSQILTIANLNSLGMKNINVNNVILIAKKLGY